MKFSVCILAVQYFGDNKIGGFGSMARQLAEGLAERGIEVSVLVPNHCGMRQEREIINGVKVYSFRKRQFKLPAKLIKEINADIYHSQNPCLHSRIAQNALTHKKHIATCRDPRDTKDFFNEFMNATFMRKLKIPINYLMEYQLVKPMIRKADQVYVPAYFLINKTSEMFRTNKAIKFLPNIIHCAAEIYQKANPIEVLFLGRLDKRKRPEIVFDLMNKFPEITFNIIGKAEENDRDDYLKNKYSSLDNVRWHGYLNRFEEKEKFESILSRSTAILNSSSREGLPLTFLEAAGMGCAIIATVNPDEFASRFGAFTTPNNLEQALEDLSKNQEKYKGLGKKAYEYVKSLYSYEIAIDAHIEEYKSILAK
jgi:glycosyltransferase involved in cell wall biosynthesis